MKGLKMNSVTNKILSFVEAIEMADEETGFIPEGTRFYMSLEQMESCGTVENDNSEQIEICLENGQMVRSIGGHFIVPLKNIPMMNFSRLAVEKKCAVNPITLFRSKCSNIHSGVRYFENNTTIFAFYIRTDEKRVPIGTFDKKTNTFVVKNA